MARCEHEGPTSWLLVMLLVVTAQVCAVAAEEPAIGVVIRGDDSIEMVQIEDAGGDGQTPIPISALAEDSPAPPEPIDSAKVLALIKTHVEEKHLALKNKVHAQTVIREKDESIKQHKEWLSQNIAKYATTNEPDEALNIEMRINATSRDLATDEAARTRMMEMAAAAKDKVDYHDAQLKKLNVIPAPNAQEIKQEVTKQLEQQHAKETQKLQEDIKANALEAKNLAFVNKQLLDKISVHTDAVAFAKQKDALQQRINKAQTDLSAAKAEQQAATTQAAQAAAVTKVAGLEAEVPVLQKQLSELKLPGSDKEDPIMSLTPAARIKVLKQRTAVQTQKTAIEEKASKYEQDTAHLEKTIADKKNEIASEKDPTRLQQLSNQLSEWEVAAVDLKTKHTASMAAENAKLASMEKTAKDMLIANVAVEKTPQAGPDITGAIKKAEDDLIKVRTASKMVTQQLSVLEQASVKHETVQALVVKMDDEVDALQKQWSEEKSQDAAQALHQKIEELKLHQLNLNSKLKEASEALSGANELSSKKQKQMLFAAQDAKSAVMEIEALKGDAANSGSFKDAEVAVEGMTKSLKDIEDTTQEAINKYEQTTKDKANDELQATKAVEDALAQAEATASEVKKLTAEVASEQEPEILQVLEAQLEASRKAAQDAQTNLILAEKQKKAMTTAVLDNGLQKEEEGLAQVEASIKASRETLLEKKQAAQLAVVESAKKNTPDAILAKKTADEAVLQADEALSALQNQEAAHKDMIQVFQAKGEEQEAKAKESAAEAKMEALAKETDKQTAAAAEARAQEERLNAENAQLKIRLEKIEKQISPNQKEIADKEAEAALEMKEDLEAKDAKIAYDHAVDKMKQLQHHATREKLIIKSETTGLTNMKLRLRKLNKIKKTTKDEVASASLATNIKEEAADEKRLVESLRDHVSEEHKAEKESAGYEQVLEEANKRRQAALKKIVDRQALAEERQQKSEAMETVRERVDLALIVANHYKKLEQDIQDAQAHIKEMMGKGAPQKEIKDAEQALSEMSAKSEKEKTKEKVLKARTEKAEMESINIQALEPLKKAETDLKALQLRLADQRKDIAVYESKLNDLRKDKVILERNLIETNDPARRLTLQTEIAKNTGLAQAAQLNIEETTKRKADLEKSNVEMIQQVTVLERRRDEVVAQSAPEIRSAIAAEALAKAQLQAKLAAETEAEKAAAAEAEAKAVAMAEGHKNVVDTKMAEILASATKMADSVPLPDPPISPESKWVWHGPKPADGELPPPPNKAAAPSDGSLVTTMAAAEKARMDSSNDKAAIAALDANIDKEQRASLVQDAKEHSTKALAESQAALAKAVLEKQNADAKLAIKETVKAADAAKTQTSKQATPVAGATKLLDLATSFLQKWVWNGDVPETGKPEVPKYMRVAAGEQVDPQPVPVAAAPAVGQLADQQLQKSEAAQKVAEAQATTANLRAEVESLTAKLEKATPEQAPDIEKQLSAKNKEYHAAKQKMLGAQAALDTEGMKLQEIKVGEGIEDPDKAIQKVKAEKEAIAARELKAAKDKVDTEKQKTEETKAKAQQTQNTEQQMKKVEQSSDSPAVKKAAAAMESKESEEELKLTQDRISAKKAEVDAKIKLQKQQAAVAKDMKRTEKAAQEAKEQADMAKKATKQVMDFEGTKYDEAVKKSAEHQINAAKLNALWNRLTEQAKTTSSFSEAESLKQQIEKYKKAEAQEESAAAINNQEARIATLNQHQVAQELDKKLAALVANVISGESTGMSRQEAEAKNTAEVNRVKATQEKDELALKKESTAKLEAKLSSLQQKRIDDEKAAANTESQMKAVQKNPVPELPKGVKEEVPKAVAAIEKQKENQLAHEAKELKKQGQETAKEELAIAMQLEKEKTKVKQVEAKAKAFDAAAAEAEKKVADAEEKKRNDKYSPAAVLEKAQQAAAASSAERAMEQTKLKIQQMSAGPTEEQKERKQVERMAEGGVPSAPQTTVGKTASAIDQTIAAEKNAVADIQEKLKALRAKISLPVQF